MTDRKPDVFFEAMLEALRGNGADVPAPNWNYEKTLVEILAELKNQNPPMDSETVEIDDLYETVLGECDESGGNPTYTLTDFPVADMVEMGIDSNDLLLYIDGDPYHDGNINIVIIPTSVVSLIAADSDLTGSTLKVAYPKTVFTPNVLNLCDPDDPYNDMSYLPTYATYDGDTVTLSNNFDASPYYDRLKRGMPVWVRVPTWDDDNNLLQSYIQITEWHTSDDYTGLTMSAGNYYIYTENYRPDTEDEETPNINPLI